MLIDGEARAGECGTWRSGVGADGTRIGALHIDGELLSVTGATRRLVACVRAVRNVRVAGVLVVTDVIQRPGDYGDEVWLTTAAPATPTLAEVGIGVDPAGVLHALGVSLLALHAAGIVHGALGPSTVVLAPDGAPLLIEVGLHAALTGATPEPSDDARRWAQLVRGLEGGDSAPLLARCADLADTGSLASALAALTAAHAADPTGAGPSSEPDRTTLGRRGNPTRVSAGTQLIRFGPGVPVVAASTASRGPVVIRPPRRRRTRSRVLGALVTVAVVTAVALWWWYRLGGLEVQTASVRATPPVAGCSTTTDVVGVIATNGRRGVIRYRWRRNDGQPTSTLSQDVRNGQRSASVHLAWTIAGHGDFRAVADLEVLAPAAIHAVGRFRYHCR